MKTKETTLNTATNHITRREALRIGVGAASGAAVAGTGTFAEESAMSVQYILIINTTEGQIVKNFIRLDN